MHKQHNIVSLFLITSLTVSCCCVENHCGCVHDDRFVCSDSKQIHQETHLASTVLHKGLAASCTGTVCWHRIMSKRIVHNEGNPGYWDVGDVCCMYETLCCSMCAYIKGSVGHMQCNVQTKEGTHSKREEHIQCAEEGTSSVARPESFLQKRG